MKKRILGILLLCCMVLTLLPVTVSAATTGAMDNIPGRFDEEIDLVGRTGDINIRDSRTYYIYSSSSDPEWVWTKKIQINGKKAAPPAEKFCLPSCFARKDIWIERIYG